MCRETLDVLSVGEHGGVGGVGWSHGQREKALERQLSEEDSVLCCVVLCCEGSGSVAAWTTSGQHEAEPLRDKRRALDSSFPRFLTCTQK